METDTLKTTEHPSTSRWRAGHLPLATWTLIGLCALAFAYQAGLSPEEREGLLLVWGAIPLEITEQDLPPFTPVSTALTLLSAQFLHFDPWHLASNLLFLALVGPLAERALGRPLFLALFLLCGAVAGLVQVAVYPASLFPIAGASGAIAGVTAASLVLSPRLGWPVAVFALWLLPDLASGLRPPQAVEQWVGGTATWAHAGGLLFGGLLALLWRRVRS